MTIFKSSTVFSLFLPVSTVSNMIYHIICITYMALSSREESLFQNKKFFNHTFFYSVRTFTLIQYHYFSKYWEDGYMGRAPPQILRGRPLQFPTSLRPRTTPNATPIRDASSARYT